MSNQELTPMDKQLIALQREVLEDRAEIEGLQAQVASLKKQIKMIHAIVLGISVRSGFGSPVLKELSQLLKTEDGF